jgi:hypothetical protein
MVTPENIKANLDGLQQKLVKQIKILEIERNLASRRGFWKGLLAGVAAMLLLMGVLGFILLHNSAATLEFAADHFLMDYMESLFAGFPEAYMTNNRERVIQTLDDFTNAMQNQRVSRDDFRNLARQIFAALQDRRLTYQELDGLLATMQAVSKPPE